MLYRFGNCSLDTARLELWRAGRRIEIEPQVMAILTYLVEHRDRVVPRTELQEAIWGARIVTDSSLNVRVRAVRRAVGDDGRAQGTIRTVQRRGYRFVADVAVSTPMPFVSPERIAEDDVEAAAAYPQGPQPSLVILPLHAVGDVERASIVALGLTCDVTARIARTRSMLVIARGTAFNLGSGPHDVRAIGRKLGVRYVMQGSVDMIGQKMGVSVALADAATRQEIWSEQYSVAVDDWIRVQEDIANLVVAALESVVDRAEQRRSLLMPSVNLDAWSAYHRGCSFMYRFTPADCTKAEYFFRRSVELEPNVPRPYAGLSFVHFQRAFLSMSTDKRGEVQQAYDYALQSLAIDPYDPMAHWALSRANMLQNEYAAARQELETSIELNPSYAIAHYSLGWVGLQLGERRLCSERIEWARRLSPYDPLRFAMLGVGALNLALMGRTTEAADRATQATLQPGSHHQVLAFAAVCHALDNRRASARALYGRLLAERPDYDVDDFLEIFPFQVQSDKRRILEAFKVLETRSCS